MMLFGPITVFPHSSPNFSVLGNPDTKEERGTPLIWKRKLALNHCIICALVINIKVTAVSNN